jgi:hypothetical protein
MGVKNRASVIGLVLLLVLAGAVYAGRRHFIGVRAACGQHLEGLAVRVKDYARTHNGKLPTSDNVAFFHGEPYAINPRQLYLADNPPSPYVWDPMPHKYVGEYHVLFSDGTVRQVPVPPVNP